MSAAIFGHTGFVGGALTRDRRFDEFFNSANAEEAKGRAFDLVVCTAMPAAKWIANRDPAADRSNLDRLTGVLETVRAETFVLISTVDVYPSPQGMDENDEIDLAACHTYGRNRLLLERFAADRFSKRLILRLPALFGTGLKKNAIFDLLHGNQVDLIHPDSRYQFYDVARLSDDIDRALAAKLDLVNMATEPIAMRDVAAEAFGTNLVDVSKATPATYDFKSRHASRLGGANGYLLDRETVLADLRTFVEREKARTR